MKARQILGLFLTKREYENSLKILITADGQNPTRNTEQKQPVIREWQPGPYLRCLLLQCDPA